MKKQKPLILEIPKPCSESWADMNPMALGRFCTHCQKTVTDITKMSDNQIVQLFQQNSDTHCIRAFASQLNRPINLPTQAPIRFYRIALALGLTILSLAAADTYARPRPPLVEQNYLFSEGDTTKKEAISGDTISISGIVLDETGTPFPGVVVKVKSGGMLKGGAITEDDGSFEIKPLKKLEDGQAYELEFSSIAYNVMIVKNVKSSTKLNRIKMQTQDDWGISTGMLMDNTRPRVDGHNNRIYYSNDLQKMGY